MVWVHQVRVPWGYPEANVVEFIDSLQMAGTKVCARRIPHVIQISISILMAPLRKIINRNPPIPEEHEKFTQRRRTGKTDCHPNNSYILWFNSGSALWNFRRVRGHSSIDSFKMLRQLSNTWMSEQVSDAHPITVLLLDVGSELTQSQGIPREFEEGNIGVRSSNS